MKEIESLPLHDAIVESIRVIWADRKVEILLKAFTLNGEKAVPHLLTFENVSDIQIPHQSPWGDSEFINRLLETNGICKMEMQSGDTISVSATSFRFEQSAS